jgi:hypothetical protein
MTVSYFSKCIFQWLNLCLWRYSFYIFIGIAVLTVLDSTSMIDLVYASANAPEGYGPKEELPFIYYEKSSLVSENLYVNEGVIIRKDVNNTFVDFRPWPTILEPNKNNLNMSMVRGPYDIPFHRVSGRTFSEPDGLISKINNYDGRYVSFIVGNTMKSSEFQISLSLVVQGQEGNYNLVFVHGPLAVEGWRGNGYYEKVSSYSSRLIDLQSLLKSQDDRYLRTKEISVVIARNSSLHTFDFIVALGKMTQTPPVFLTSRYDHYVNGTVRDYDYGEKESEYLFHDLTLQQKVSLHFANVPIDSKVSSNGWHIDEIRQLNMNSSEKTKDLFVKGNSENKVPLYKVSPSMILNINFTDSITNLGSKDYLFLSTLIILSCSFLLIRSNMFR